MNELQLTFVPDGTKEQAQAVSLHYEIMSAAQSAVSSLLMLGRKLKEMRDTRGYEHLGFETFAQYTEQAAGIRQRQAYNYISVVERIPARLVEENAAAGVTKLALLARLGPADQQEVAEHDLANITVSELKQLIEEKNGLAEQLSLLQEEPAAEAQAEEVDLDALRAEIMEQARAEVKEAHRKEIDRALREQGEKLAADRKAAEQHAAAQAKKEAERAAREKVALAKAEAAKKAEADIDAARREAAEEARRQQEEQDRAVMEQARQEAEKARQAAEAANARAEEVAKELKLAASPESTRFALLFDDLQDKAAAMLELADQLEGDGRKDEATRYRGALRQALAALIEQAGAEQTGLEQ